MCNKQTNYKFIHFCQTIQTVQNYFPGCVNNGRTIALWGRVSLSVAVQNMNSYHHFLKPILFLNLLLVDKCFSETTIQPTQKDGCPLFLVHGGPGYCQSFPVCSVFLSLKLLLLGGSRLKRAEASAHPTEWAVCKRERGEGGSTCLYRST